MLRFTDHCLGILVCLRPAKTRIPPVLYSRNGFFPSFSLENAPSPQQRPGCISTHIYDMEELARNSLTAAKNFCLTLQKVIDKFCYTPQR
jgi:hypothetical protein